MATRPPSSRCRRRRRPEPSRGRPCRRRARPRNPPFAAPAPVRRAIRAIPRALFPPLGSDRGSPPPLGLALLASSLGCGGGTPSAPSPSPSRRPTPAPRRRGAAPRDDARREGRPDGPGRPLVPPLGGRHPRALPRLAAERRRLLAARQDGAGLGRHVRPLPGVSPSRRASSIPLVYGIDAVHGHNNVVGAVIFPHNIGLGCTRDAALVERVARATAEEVAATGIDWTFSPCIAVARDERWGRTYESFGETPELVSEMAAAAVRGYQPTILACAKHYLADGGTAGGRDQGDAQMDEATLRAIHLPGLPRGGRGRRRLGDGVLQQLERPEDARPPLPAHRRAEGRARLPGLRRLRLGRDRPAAGRLRLGRRDRGQRRHRHGHGAGPLSRVRRHAEVARPVRPRPAGAHRRRRAAHPAPEGRARALGQALRGPRPAAPGRLRRAPAGRTRGRAQVPRPAEERGPRRFRSRR